MNPPRWGREPLPTGQQAVARWKKEIKILLVTKKKKVTKRIWIGGKIDLISQFTLKGARFYQFLHLSLFHSHRVIFADDYANQRHIHDHGACEEVLG